MKFLKTISIATVATISMLLAVACTANSAQAASDGKPTAKVLANPASFAFTESDLEAYEKGLAAETALVLAARERGNNAKTLEERAAAAQDEWDDQTIPGGAKAAGISVERYRDVRKAVDRVLETLNYQGKIKGPLELDLEHATPEMKQRLTSDPFAELSPVSAAALRARMNTLVPIWSRYMGLVAVNG
jgi:hypothetical protein